MNYLLAGFFAYAGHVSFLGNIGDYATHALSLSENAYATGSDCLQMIKENS